MIYTHLCIRWLAVSVLVSLACGLPASLGSSAGGRRSLQKKEKYRRKNRIGPRKASQHQSHFRPRALTGDEEVAGSVKSFLSKYGYFRKGKPLNLQMGPPEGASFRPERDAGSEAIRMFQSYFGLEQTGLPDKATKELMQKDRCGVADIPEAEPELLRRDRQSPAEFQLLGEKWQKPRITWRLETHSRQLTRGEQRKVMKDAFNTWQQEAPLDFVETGGKEVDINILFGRRDHKDGYAFDGPGMVLAHAFGPGEYALAGDMHLDEDERWAGSDSNDLYLVAVHELGHSLGLAHSRDPGAIMYPYYGFTDKLGPDDIKAIKSLYGARITDNNKPRTTAAPRRKRTTTTTTTTRRPGGGRGGGGGGSRGSVAKSAASTQAPPTSPPAGCQSHFDVVIQGDPQNREIYTGIQGTQLSRFTPSGLLPGYPTSVDTVYPGAPAGANAVFTVPETSSTYFVKGNRVWKYHGRELHQDYPKILPDEHFPETIRFVMTLLDTEGNRRVIVFGTTRYHEYNFDDIPPVRRRPRFDNIPQYWPEVSRDINYAVMGHDDHIYLVASDSHLILNRMRSVVHGGKQAGQPKWMQAACRMTQSSSGSAVAPNNSRTAFVMAAVASVLCMLGRK